MEDNQTVDVADTEVQAERASPERLSIRASLEQQLDEDTVETGSTESVEEETAQEVAPEPQVERPGLLPPADMRREEKEAFLNPTAANAHVLQEYLNRRAYETRSDYSRKMAEVEELRKQTAGVYDTIKQYENDYAKQGLSLADITRRSVAWDQAMQANPRQAAREWLDAYGLSPQDLMEMQQDYQEQYQQAPQQNYLTREEAERIADERAQNILKSQEQKAVEYYNQRVVESFMNSKPIFRDPETASQIEADMAPVVQALSSTGRYGSPDQVLETAYNYVINGNPAYSSLVSKMTAKPAIQEQKAAVEKAKAASRSISGSAGSGTPKIETKNLRDNLRRRLVGGD